MNRGNKQTGLNIMDFAKTIDKIPHRRLLHKLDYYGIIGSTHKWIGSWLSAQSQQVVLDDQTSHPVPILSVVSQGAVIEPMLFLIFINGLASYIKSSVRLFADDCVLYRNIHSLQIGRSGQSCALRGRLENEVLCCQMSLYGSDSPLFTQTNYSRLHTEPANVGNRSVRKISWHNNY